MEKRQYTSVNSKDDSALPKSNLGSLEKLCGLKPTKVESMSPFHSNERSDIELRLRTATKRSSSHSCHRLSASAASSLRRLSFYGSAFKSPGRLKRSVAGVMSSEHKFKITPVHYNTTVCHENIVPVQELIDDEAGTPLLVTDADESNKVEALMVRSRLSNSMSPPRKKPTAAFSMLEA